MTEELVNLDNCAREPIHIPGAIQPHGLLFVLRESDLSILQVSENVLDLLGMEAEDLLGRPLTSFLSVEQAERVRAAIDLVDPGDHNPVDLRLAALGDGRILDGFVHRFDGFALLELEPVALKPDFHDFYKLISKLTTVLHSAKSLDTLLQDAATGIRTLTGFDRVMIYRFAPSFEGEVVAESKVDAGDPYLGLWYPASDIPEQARRLYALNPLRTVADTRYAPAYLVPAINPDSSRPVDLSYAVLRSMSPIHCEYLQNMGVAASMSVSIMRGDKLWGLVSCHHGTTRTIPYEVRKACTFVGQVLSGEISRREVERESAYTSGATRTLAKFLELMAGASEPLLGLVDQTPNLLDLIPATGAAVILGERVLTVGQTPGDEELLEIVDLLRKSNAPLTFTTRSLMYHFRSTETMCATASGVIALEIGKQPRSHVLFFRPELARTVLWGGNPEKPAFAAEDGFGLSPRKSFAVWKEEMRGVAAPWTQGEIYVANELRNLIMVVSYGKGEEPGRLAR